LKWITYLSDRWCTLNEFRKDYVLNRWVAIAPERAKRPDEFRIEPTPAPPAKTCPFCPDKNPGEVITEVGDPWHIRVIANKYPIVRPNTPLDADVNFYANMTAHGHHEVIIETDKHSTLIQDLPKDEFVDIVNMYIERIKALRSDSEYVLVFKNHGKWAGASIYHEHAQVLTLPFVPNIIAMERKSSEEYYTKYNRCIYCDVIKKERETERFVYESNKFVVIAPYASRFAGELWILPKDHVSDVVLLKKEEIAELAHTLQTVLKAYDRLLDDPPYNYVIHTSDKMDAYHFHIEIYPRLQRPASVEFGTGMFVNVLSPEVFAKDIRGVINDI